MEGSSANKSSLTQWRYIHPMDENSTTIVNWTTYYFYKHCVCKFTKTQGFYNRTHSTKGHKFTRKIPGESDSGTVATEGTSLSGGSSVSTGASTISSLSSGSATPGCSLGAVSHRPSKPPSSLVSVPDDVLDSDPGGLQFVGAFMADANPSNAAWVSVATDPPDYQLATGVTFDPDPENDVCNNELNDPESDVCNNELNNASPMKVTVTEPDIYTNQSVLNNCKASHYPYTDALPSPTTSYVTPLSSLMSLPLDGLIWVFFLTSIYYQFYHYFYIFLSNSVLRQYDGLGYYSTLLFPSSYTSPIASPSSIVPFPFAMVSTSLDDA